VNAHCRNPLTLLLGVLASATALWAAPARAQLGPALAGRSAQADNAVTVTQKPAGITRLPSWQLVFDTIVAVSDNRFDVDEAQTSTSGRNPKNDPDIVGVPQFAFAIPVGDRFGSFAERFSFGFGLSVPQGYGTDYGSSWAGRYFAQESSLVFVSAQPVAAVRVSDWLSLGAGASIMYVSSEAKVAVNNDFFVPGADDGRLKVDVDGVSVGPVVSALLEPLPDLRFGLSWRGEIEPELEGRPKFTDLEPALELVLDTAGILNEKVDINMRVPQSVQVGFYYRPFARLALMGDLTWVDWSRFGTVDIEVGTNSLTSKTNYDDIWIGSAGAEYDFTEHWSGSLGFTYVSSAISNEDRGLALPLDEFYIFGVGAYGQLSDRLGVQTNLLAIFGGDGKVDQQGTVTGRLVGEYDRRRTFALQIAFVWGERVGRRHR
jgi:long-chain fatty acid transport protein